MDWRTRLYLRWDVYCQKAGLGSPSFQHGLDLRDGSFANNYVAKWGLEDEMTKGHIKKGKAGGKHLRPPAGSPGRQERQASGCAVCGVRQGFQGQTAVVLVEWLEGQIQPGRKG